MAFERDFVGGVLLAFTFAMTRHAIKNNERFFILYDLV